MTGLLHTAVFDCSKQTTEFSFSTLDCQTTETVSFNLNMKNKTYSKFNVLLAIMMVILGFCALNPSKAKNIACKVAVFFNLYETQKICELGCPKKPPPKKKVSKKKKIQKCECKLSESNELLLAASDTQKWLSFGLIHLAIFLGVKLIHSFAD